MKKYIPAIAFIFIIASFTKKEITWVAIGDSITYLNEHTEKTGNRITKGYMIMTTEKLPNIHYINQGHDGWTSGGIAENIKELGLVKADVYSIFLGTNDWWQGRPIGSISDYTNNTGNETVYGSFRIIINNVRSLNASAKIILITPMQRVDFVYINDVKNIAYGSYKEKNGQTLEQFANAIRLIGKQEHFAVVDLFHTPGMDLKNLVKYKRLKDPATGAYKKYVYPDFINIPFNPETDEYPYPVEAGDITFDGLHPTDKGYNIISGLLVRLMKKY
ncbi:MAG: SGNH/GDSL hydrolase family protein [Flavitalea sp.]